MIKRNLKTLILTSVIILIPVLMGLFLWNLLPDQIPTHWNAAGEVDGWSNKPFAVFVLPLFLLAIHWFCAIVTSIDPKHRDISDKMMALVLWICPVMSLAMGSIVFAAGLGYEHILDVPMILCLLMGAMFVFLGNYLPKCKQNYTIGIKLPWTLANEENWNKTHRFGGWVWTIGGVVTMATAFLGNFWLLLGILLVMAFAPMVYSYLYYRKHSA